jgi:hypothetical protein
MQTPVSKVGGDAADATEDKKGAVLIGDTVALWDEVRKFRLPLYGFMPIFLPSQKEWREGHAVEIVLGTAPNLCLPLLDPHACRREREY